MNLVVEEGLGLEHYRDQLVVGSTCKVCAHQPLREIGPVAIQLYTGNVFTLHASCNQLVFEHSIPLAINVTSRQRLSPHCSLVYCAHRRIGLAPRTPEREDED